MTARRRMLGVGLLAALLAPGEAGLRAQAPSPFVLESWTASLIGGYQYREDIQHFTLAQRSRLQEQQRGSRQGLELGFQGFAYHPLLLDYDIDLGLGLSQNRYETNTGQFDGSTDEFLSRYDVSIDLLRLKAYGVNVRLQKARSELNSTFFNDRTFDTRSRGITWQHSSRTFPTSAAWSMSRRESRGNYRINERRQELRVRNRWIGARGSSLVDYRLQELRETTSNQDVRNHGVLLEQRFDTRDENPWAFTLGERYLRQSGTVFIRSMSAGLRTVSPTRRGAFLTVDTNIYDYDTRGLRSISRTGEITLAHDLYESLHSTIGGAVRNTRAGPGRTTTIRGDAGVNYRKQIPVGMFSIGLQAGRQKTDDLPPDRAIDVIDEGHEASFLEPIYLERPEADPATLVVTDEDGLEVFREGTDYLVIAHQDLVEVRILPEGDIEEGQALLFRYSYRLDSSIRYRVNRSGASGSLGLWNIWTFRASIRRDDEIPITGDVERLNDRTERVLGGTMRLGPSSTSVEYRERDEDRTPLLSRAVSQSFSFMLPARTSLSLRGALTHTRFPDRMEETTNWSASAVLTAGPILATRWTVRSSYLNFDETRYGGERAAFSVEAETTFRAFQLAARAHHIIGDIEDRGRDRSTRVDVTVVREL